MDLGLRERTAVVTGGGGRIGSEDCKLLAAEGATVVALDIDAEAARETAESVEDQGGDALAVECDLTDRDEVAQAIDHIRDDAGVIDVLVNNAAFLEITEHYAKVGEYRDDMWEQQLEVDLTGTYNITKQVFPAMCDREWGRIINMSSMAGWKGGHGQASYSTTKAGLIGLTKTLAMEGGRHGVTANVIAPGAVSSEFADMSPEGLRNSERPVMDRIRQATAVKRLGREEDVANMVTYLASEQANYVTGQVIGVNGGGDLWNL